MLNFYASLFQAYKAVFRPKHASPSLASAYPHSALDSEATLLGNAYRGSGILVGILGALIIFCAVAPMGFGLLNKANAIYFGIAEVILMVWVIQTLSFVRKGALKERWIKARQTAEFARYQPLQDALAQDLTSLSVAVSPLLGGEHCQISYNRERHHQYHAIEAAAEKTTRIGFVISLVAAITHLVIHADALIFLTAALPAAVGALHGINTFLHLEELAEEHQQMADDLSHLDVQFRKSALGGDLDSVRSVATTLHELLTTGHQGWINIASRLEVRAP